MGKKKMYFNEDVENAIIKYNKSDNDKEKNKIYRFHISKAFDKLVENIINTFKFDYMEQSFDDVKQEVVSKLIVALPNYDETKGFKAYSFFSIVAKNYLIQNNNANYKRLVLHRDIDSDEYKEIFDNRIKDDYSKYLLEEIIRYFEENVKYMFQRDDDIIIANGVIDLLKDIDSIDNFNKKYIYVLLKEMLNMKTFKITRVINEMKRTYKRLISEFDRKGFIGYIK